MSFDFRTIKQPSGDPILKYITGMQRALAKKLTEDLVDQLDDSEDIFSDGQDVDSAVKFQTDLNSNHVFRFDKHYYPSNDDQWLVLWLQGYNMGNTLRDFTRYPDTVYLRDGEPILVDGYPFDYGMYDESIGVKSRALRLNRTQNYDDGAESFYIENDTKFTIGGQTTGFTIFIRFRVFSIAEQGGIARTLFEKIDDSIPNNAYMLQIRDDGRLVWIVKKAGVTTAKQTPAGTITTDTVYDVFVTFTITGPVMHVYVNNVDKTLTDFVETVNWQEDLTRWRLSIFRRGFGSSGFVYGDLYDFKFYQSKVASATEVGYHYTNKLSLSNIPFGQVIMANYWSTRFDISLTSSFTSGSFTSASFNL